MRSQRVLLVMRGVFRGHSFPFHGRRIQCFGSIHSAPSHFVSVNSTSSGGLPTSPSPLCLQSDGTGLYMGRDERRVRGKDRRVFRTQSGGVLSNSAKSKEGATEEDGKGVSRRFWD
jgi:hypothetical protein